jgi:tetratricopeptide (TPR) repeat protein
MSNPLRLDAPSNSSEHDSCEQIRDAEARYRESWQLSDLDKWISLLRIAIERLESRGAEPFVLATYLIALSRSLGDRYFHLGLLDDVQERICLCEAALKSLPEDNRTEALLELGTVLRARFELQGDIADIRRAVSLHEQVLERVREGGAPFLAAALFEVGTSLNILFTRTSGLKDIEQAASYLREAAPTCPAEDPLFPSILDQLSVSLVSVYTKKALGISILDEACSFCHRSLELRQLNHRDRGLALHTLGRAHFNRFARTKDEGSLQEAIDYSQLALDFRAKGHPHRLLLVPFNTQYDNYMLKLPFSTLNNVAAFRLSQYSQSARFDHLTHCVELFREILALRPPADPSHGASLINLAVAVNMRFGVLGNIEDLEENILLLRSALEHVKDPFNYALTLDNLNDALTLRYKLLGDLNDLEEAIGHSRRALGLRDVDEPGHAVSLMNLATALISRFDIRGDEVDLNEAVGSFQSSLSGAIAEHLRSNVLHQLSSALLLRSGLKTALSDDIDKAVHLSRESLSLRGKDHWLVHECIDGLSKALLKRYERDHTIRDYEEAWRLLEMAKRELPDGHIYRAQACFELACLSLTEGGPGFDTSAAIELCKDGISDTSQSAHIRLKKGVEILEKLEKVISKWPEEPVDRTREERILELYHLAIQLVPRVAYLGRDIKSQLRALERVEHLATAAAIHAVAISRLDVAVELLEEGRAVLWSQRLRLRTAFDNLPVGLADKMKSLALKLEKGSVAPKIRNQENKATIEEEAVRLRCLGEEFEATIMEVRSLPGLDRFMLSDTFDSLRAVADRGPVVLLVTRRTASWGILLQHKNNPQTIPLTTDPSRLKGLCEMLRISGLRHRNASFATSDTVRDVRLSLNAQKRLVIPSSDCEDGRDAMMALLGELWKDVMYPIVRALQLKVRFN